MRVRIHSPLATITLVPWYEAELGGRMTQSGAAIDAPQLRSLLAADPDVLPSLRRLVVDIDAHATGVEWCSDEQLAVMLARLLERCLIQAQLEERPLLYTTPVEDSLLPEHVVEPMNPVDTEQHWIEVLLVGEDDEGLPGVRCQIILPNGKTIVRTTDRFGLIRIDGVEDAGNCEISFPDLDEEAWEGLL